MYWVVFVLVTWLLAHVLIPFSFSHQRLIPSSEKLWWFTWWVFIWNIFFVFRCITVVLKCYEWQC